MVLQEGYVAINGITVTLDDTTVKQEIFAEVPPDTPEEVFMGLFLCRLLI